MNNLLVLDALANRRVFVMYRAEPRDDGKTDKIPTHPTTGENIDGQDPANWMYPQDVLTWVQLWNASKPPGVLEYGPGLVISEKCGLFAIDLDNCRDTNGGWMPHVSNFEARFPGAYTETSRSNSGRHIFGSYTGAVPAHGTRNKLYRMEAYTRARFMALTGHEAAGSILTDCTTALTAFLGEFFPEHAEADHGNEWTRTPVAAWNGPTDDAQLIAKAMRSLSPKAVFGAGAAFNDLWEANESVLARAFPSQNAHSPWDMSAADQALANHLAFWTGKNCEHMLKLMKQSKLVRDKWDRHDYLMRTILGACGTQKECYTDTNLAQKVSNLGVANQQEVPLVQDSVQPVPLPPTIPPPPTVAIELPLPGSSAPKSDILLLPGELPPVGMPCTINQMKQFFKDHCYVRDVHAIQLPDGTSITKERFDVMFGGPQYPMTIDGQKPTKSAWDAYTLSEIERFPRVETQFFKPGQPTGLIRIRDGRREINCYKPADIRRVKGDPAPFLDLVYKMLPAGNDGLILLYYMAACVRYLGTKFMWTVFLQGAKGNGKTTIAKILEYCISLRYTHWAKADQLGEKFNSVFVDKLLLIVDEMYNDDVRELQEILKQLVTATRIETRPMYAEKIMKEVCYNLFLISNHKNGVRIDLDERRYAPLFCAQQSKPDRLRDGLDNAYFIKLHKWLWGNDCEGAAIVYDYLMDLAIPDELNPAADCLVAPLTTSTQLAATASLGSVEQELMEAIKQEHEGFRGGWISSQHVDFLLARIGREKAIPRNARPDLIMSLGYIPHPSLPPDGRLTVALSDGARPHLYVTKGHLWAVDYLTPEQVKAGFLEAQKRS